MSYVLFYCIIIFKHFRSPCLRFIEKMTGVTRKRVRPTNLSAKIVKSKSQKKAPIPDKKITDFFPVRKSNRITAKTLEVNCFHNCLNCVYLQTERTRQLEELVMTGANEADLEVAICGEKGRGLRAMRPFARNEFVVEYKGVISHYFYVKNILFRRYR